MSRSKMYEFTKLLEDKDMLKGHHKTNKESLKTKLIILQH